MAIDDPQEKNVTHEPVAPPVPPKVGILDLLQFADRSDWVLMFSGAVAAFASGAGRPGFSFIMSKMITKLAEAGDIESAMAQYALIMVYLGIGIFLCSAMFVAFYQIAASRQVNRIQQKYFVAALQQEIGWHDEHKPGELTARMVGDTKVILNGINDKFGLVFRCAGMFFGGYAFGFAQSWELTLVMTGCLPLLAGAGAVMSTQIKKLTEQTRSHFAKASEKAMETMENIKTTQVFGAEEHEAKRFEVCLADAAHAGIRKEFVGNTSVGTTYFIMYSCYTILFFFSSYLLEWNRITVGDVLGTFFSVLMGSFGLGLMVPSLTAYAEARAAAYHVYATILRKPLIDINEGGETLPDGGMKQHIEFRDVHFAYPTRKDQPLFKGFNMIIKKGTTVAFSGASGCGKSSIVGMLQRFYDPDAGAALVDGKDLRELDVKWWRSQIGIVSQEPSLFSGTIAENVKVGCSEASHEDVIEACKKANIHDAIMRFPQQYDTPVGSVGSQLSGGQKQRIAIARAIIKRPQLLLLDEATSALDRQSEMEVQAALEDVMRNTSDEHGGKLTVVIVAHRLATIRNVDVIHYLVNQGVDQGCLVAESGTFDALMNLNGAFANLAKKQIRSSADNGESPSSPQAATPSHASSPRLAASPRVVRPRKGEGMDDAADELQVATNLLKEVGEKEIESANVGMSRILGMNKENIWAIAIAFVGSAITGSVYPAYSIVLGHIMTVFAEARLDYVKLREKTPLFACLFLVIGGGSLLGWIMQAFYAVAGERLTVKLRSKLFRNILRQDQTFFDTPGRDPGSLSAVLAGDAEVVHQLWGPSIGYKIQMGCAVCGGIIIAFYYSWKLALVSLSTLPALAFGSAIQRMMTIHHTSKDLKEKKEDTITAEAFTNVRTVVAFNLQEDRRAAYQLYAGEVLSTEYTNAYAGGFAFGFSQFVMFGVAALIYWYGGLLISRGQATFQDVITCSMAIMMAGVGAGEAGGFAAKVADALVASKRVFAIIDRVPEIDPDHHGSASAIEKEDIVVDFDAVGFSYPARPGVPVLHDFASAMPFGSQNGLIGQTGSGKSTTIQLLARFYNPTDGVIRVNGEDLRAVDVRLWRSKLSLVLQEPSLFSGTIAENIRYSNPDASMEDVVRVAKWAAIHDDIMAMPMQYETEVGYRGRALSGGQKQRVAIARGLLRTPSILLLDEATSALDNATEALVQDGLRQAHALHNMTVISVAHRLTTIQHCDKIILLDKGVVLEEGSHEELMTIVDGEYKKRFELYHQSTA